MTSDLPNELATFQHFINDQIAIGARMSPEESVAAFREYQQQLSRAKREIEPALARSLQGKSKPLDISRLKDRVTSMLVDEGIEDE